MTIQQVSEMYGYSITSLKKNFTRTAAAIQKKYGVTIVKIKKNKKVDYQIMDHRATTMFDENLQVVPVECSVLKLPDYQFRIFLGIMMTPQGVFRGTREEFLNYVKIPVSKKNLSMLEQALKMLIEKDFIVFGVDEDYIIIFVRRSKEKQILAGINAILCSQQIVRQKNKRIEKFSQLMKVWLAIEICINDQPITCKDVSSLTNLSEYQVREAWKLLKEKNVFQDSLSIDFKNGHIFCHGKNVIFNGLIDNKTKMQQG